MQHRSISGLRLPAQLRSPWIKTPASPQKRYTWACLVLFSLILMNITPVLQTAGAPLAALAALLSVFDPFAAFLFIAASQIAPDAPGSPLTLAQLFVACWTVTLPINGCLRHWSAIGVGMRYAFVFIIWWSVIGAINGTIDDSWIYAWIACAIACTYVPRANGDYRGLLWMLALGAGLALIGPWGAAFGLPVEGKVYEHILRGGSRMGAGRGDVNVAAQNLGFFLWTVVALLLPAALVGQVNQRSKWSVVIVLVIAGAGAAILDTGSRGGLGYLLLGGLATAGLTFIVRSLSGPMLSRAAVAGAALMLAAPIIWPSFLDTPPGKMLLATMEFNERQSLKGGGESITAGRAGVWNKFLDIALQYPLAGAPAGATVDMGEFGIVTLGESAGGTGHNVWLDTAASRGFPGAIMFVLLFFAPLADLLRRRGARYAQPFVVAHVMVFLVFFNLSVGNWKTFWALHALSAVAAAPRRQSVMRDRELKRRLT